MRWGPSWTRGPLQLGPDAPRSPHQVLKVLAPCARRAPPLPTQPCAGSAAGRRAVLDARAIRGQGARPAAAALRSRRRRAQALLPPCQAPWLFTDSCSSHRCPRRRARQQDARRRVRPPSVLLTPVCAAPSAIADPRPGSCDSRIGSKVGGRMCTRWYKYRVHTVTKLYGNSRYHSNRGCNALVPRTRRLISQSQPDDGQAGALQRRPPGPPRVRVPGVHLAACAGASSREVAHCMRARVRLWVSLRLLRAYVRAARQTDLTARRVRVRASSWLGMLPSTAGKLQRPAHAAGVPRSRAACAPATTERRARGRALSAARGT